MIELNLPYPPTINKYWRSHDGRNILSKQARLYRSNVLKYIFLNKLKLNIKEKISLTINIFPPDKRKRDIDNIIKPILDSLEHGGVIVNDFQIDILLVYRKNIVKNGNINLRIEII